MVRRSIPGHPLAALTLGLFLWVSGTFAQSSAGALFGTVRDSTGAVVAGAVVRLTNPATNMSQQTATNELGAYQFPLLQPATYNLEAESAGFKKFLRTGIVVHVNQQPQVDVQLEVGELSEQVSVTAETPLLDTASSSLGGIITGQQVSDLPLNARQVFSLATLTPGVIPSTFTVANGSNPARFNQAVSFSTDGSYRQSAKVLVDGQDVTLNVNNPSFQGVAAVPGVDSVKEFKVQTNNFSAEFGRAGGGVVNVILKSGTNQLRGSAFEFLRNSRLDANDFFANRAGRELTSFKRNQFGVTVGGPVLLPRVYDGRNKTFFFFGYEALRERQASFSAQRVPTDLERAGDFSQTFTSSGILISIYDPFTTSRRADGTFQRQPFAGNSVPRARFNPVAAKLAPFYPLPNNPGAGPERQGNFAASGAVGIDIDRYDTKIDHEISPAARLMFRYSRLDSTQSNPNFFANLAGGGSAEPIITDSAALSYTRIINSATVADASFSFSRLYNPRYDSSLGFDVTTIGLPAFVNSAANHRVFPRFAVAGHAGLGNTADTLVWSFANMYSSRGSLSTLRGRHSLKAGGEWQVRQVNHSQGGNTGTYNFAAGFTQGPEPQRPSATTGNAFASLLLGTPQSGSFGIVPSIATQNHYFGAYLQDDVRLSGKLTINLGLRYELELPRDERYNRQNYWDFAVENPLSSKVGLPLRGGLQFAGVSGNPRSPYDADFTNFSPRFGFAYQLANQTVVRGGYGVFYGIPPIGAAGLGGGNVVGYSATTSMVPSLDGFTPYRAIDNPFPEGFIQPAGNSDGLLTQVGQGVGSVLRDVSTPYNQRWNLNLQRQFANNLVFEAAYAGSRGVHLQVLSMSYNQLPNDLLAEGNRLNDLVANPFFGHIATGTLAQQRVQRKQLLRPFPHFTGVTVPKHTIGNSTYHSLQMRIEKRFSRGVSFLAAYTNSKLITDSDAAEGFLGPRAGYQDYMNFQLERALSAMDASQRLVLSYTWELPFGRNKPWGASWNKALDAVLGGWQMNGITSLQAGFPISVGVRTDSSQSAGHGAQRPNSNGRSARLSSSRSRGEKIKQWFDTSTFSQPAPFTFGNTARTLPDVRQDGQRNFDLSIFKNFRLREGMGLQFRAESFNAFNRPQMGTPDTAFGSPTFGTISTQSNSPRQIQLALRLNF